MSPFSACPGVPTPAWLTAGLYNNVWFHFIWLSNELRTPKILVCPSDAEKTPARTWDASPDGGFANGHYYQNRAVSYLTALDVFPSDPDGLVTGDRNVRFSNNNAPCSSGVGPCRGLNSAGFGIGAGLHVEAGNFLFTDGRVEELSSDGFFKRWLSIYGDGRETHYLTP